MDIRQLRYFEAVARHRHFTHAAGELHVAQSALSRQVGLLERELGVELLRRTTRSVEPSEAGELVAARARAILAETEAIRSEIDELRGLLRGHLTVGAMLFGGQLDIPAILASFTARYPQVEVSLREGTAERMLAELGEGSLDVTFALEVEPPDGVERLALSSEELAVATSPDHPLAGEKRLPVKALAGHRLIAFHRGSTTRTVVDEALASAGVEPRIALEANDFALVRALVARGVGVAILPRSFLARPGPRISYRALSPALELRVVLWWRAGRRLSPPARAFVEFAAAYGAPRASGAPGASRAQAPTTRTATPPARSAAPPGARGRSPR